MTDTTVPGHVVLARAGVCGEPADRPAHRRPTGYARDGSGFRLRAEKNPRLSSTTAAALEWVVPK